MKVITIGRDPECNIVLDDNLISRRHAVLRLHGTGKIEIIDYSSNGTFINGTRIVSNTPLKIHRKDAVSFAHAKTLDWSQIPDPSRKPRMIIIIVFIASVLVTIAGIVVSHLPASKSDSGASQGIEVYENTEQPAQGNGNATAKPDGTTAQPEKPNQEEASSSDIKLAPDSRILNEVDRKKREQIEREKKKKEEEAKRKQEAEAKAKKEAEAAKAKKEPTRRRGTM
ncbi:FHA domain-containing protein [Muribaculum sp. NM65_B17]|uniref:FHA domain-containing protein n=1 Tax=unclassified Muribaculum TaxID=2622126 RepID=UPI00109391E5|nr:FHA domain-containing protein [Muribaculum sp. NM65_B17]TGY05163.1 FHA domain-containing protein [Muribaculum sp. NM65_B17]THG44598.1 FHA domain-containing protein [Muribaculaceae bacterium]